jgi:Peptidase family M23
MATKRITSTLAGLVVTLVLVATTAAPGEQIPATAPGADHDHQEYEEEGHAVEALRQEPDALEAAGAKVFSAGAFTLAGSIRQPAVQRLLANLWERLGDHESKPTRRPTAVGNAPAGYAWPVRPFDRQHPVRGYFGDPRIGMTPHGMRSSFHFGIDISAPDGTAVYATLTGTVVLESFRPEVVAIAAPDGRTEFEYWHIVPAISDGAHAVAGKTVLGHIGKGWGHVHFSDRRNGVYVNPLRPGALGPYADSTPPVVKSLRFERHDHGISREALRGRVDLVAEAFDVTPLAVPKPWANRPVTPAIVRWRLVDPAGRTVVPWATAIDFRMRIPNDDAYASVYASWTRQNRPWSNGRYRIVLARSWDTTTLVPGRYQIEVSVADTRGNSGSQRFPVRVANRF